MSQLSELWNGTPSQTQIAGSTPWIKAPGYDFSFELYDYMKTLIGQPAPRWGGFGAMEGLGGKKNPYVDDQVNLASKYMNMGMPTVFGQAQGAIGKFMSPNFQNPWNRLQQGGAPQYFGAGATPPQMMGSGGLQMPPQFMPQQQPQAPPKPSYY